MKNKLRIKLNAMICTLGIMAAMFNFVTPAYAANEAVTLTDVSASSTEVAVEGSTNAEAIIVQVRDATGDNILAMKSFAVVDGAFSGSVTDITIEEDTEYSVYVADYEGGDFATETFSLAAEEETVKEDSAKAAKVDDDASAKTGDTTEVALIALLMIVSVSMMMILNKKSEK